jgi:TonB family protein
MLNEQLRKCWRFPENDNVDRLPVVTLSFALKRDGSLDGVPVVVDPKNDHAFATAARAAVAAVRQCTPLSLPKERYEIWKKVTWRFDPRDQELGSSEGTYVSGTTTDDYIAGIRTKLRWRARFVTAPEAGRVEIAMIMSVGGGVMSRVVRKSSDNDELDALALYVVDQTQFDPAPIGSKGEPIAFDVVIDFVKGMMASDAELGEFERAVAKLSIEQAAIGAYVRRVRSKITRCKKVVPTWKDRPMVIFTVGATGKVHSRRILVSSGDDEIDGAALKLIDNCGPFLPFMKEMNKQSINVPLRIDFSLRNPLARKD